MVGPILRLASVYALVDNDALLCVLQARPDMLGSATGFLLREKATIREQYLSRDK